VCESTRRGRVVGGGVGVDGGKEVVELRVNGVTESIKKPRRKRERPRGQATYVSAKKAVRR